MCRGPRKDCHWLVYVKNGAGAGRERGRSAEALAKMGTHLSELRWQWKFIQGEIFGISVKNYIEHE